MGTETFNMSRALMEIRYSTDVYRDDLAATLNGLANVPVEEAEHFVAISGEDERAYGLRRREAFLEAFCEQADAFLCDDDGGFHEMVLYASRHPRSDAMLEFWFHVRSPAGEGGVWFRQLVIGVDAEHVYAGLG